MSVVLDASATIALLYGEASLADLTRLEEAISQSGAVVPQVWRLEVVNVLLMGYRRKRHELKVVREYLFDLSRPVITVDGETGSRAWNSTFELAARHKLTSYDAAYLELAARVNAPLATLDKELIRAARSEGVELFWT